MVLWGEAGLGGLLKVELLEAVEWRGESESCQGGDRERQSPWKRDGQEKDVQMLNRTQSPAVYQDQNQSPTV